MKGKLVLEDGSVFHGELVQACDAVGEVVFYTGMGGYHDVLSDPSYSGQIVTMTYPLMGNIGMIDLLEQKPFVGGFIISELCEKPNHYLNKTTLCEYLEKTNTPCLYNVDTRAITRHIRNNGTMRGVIVADDMAQADVDALLAQAAVTNLVEAVTTKEAYAVGEGDVHVVVLDLGVKPGVLDFLQNKGARVTVVPATATADEILALDPSGIVISNGPGNPKDVSADVVATVKALAGQKPMLGVALGHQVIALALGADTKKLKFGHRGANQPVKDLANGRVYIMSENYSYVVDEASLAGTELEVLQKNVNDDSVEALRHKSLPIFTIQYYPEANVETADNYEVVGQFWALMEKGE